MAQLKEGDRVRVRLDGRCRVELASLVTATTGRRADSGLFKRQVDALRGHRSQADHRLGRVIRIVPGSDHPYQVLYIDALGREAPIQLDGQHQVMGGDYAAEELQYVAGLER